MDHPGPALLSLSKLIQWRGLILSPLDLTSVSVGKRNPLHFRACECKTCGMEIWSTSRRSSSWSMPFPRQKTRHPALLSEATSLLLATSVSATPCELLFGGCYHRMGEFPRASHSLHYYLACQGRRVVLQGGDVTRPFHESRVNWVIDPEPPASRRPATEASPAPTPAILMPPSGASSQPPRRQKVQEKKKEEGCARSQ